MKENTKVIVHGYTGKLGAAICRAISARDGFEIAAGVAVDAAAAAFPTCADIADCGVKADVVIDASSPGALGGLLKFAAARGVPLVICTTGHSEEDMRGIERAAETVAILKSANMSYGVNLLINLLERYAGPLYRAGFDVEIIEKHHNQKADAPSGTALVLADAVRSSVGDPAPLENVYGRSAHSGRRGRVEIGVHAVRGGTINGEHTVLFAGRDEVIEFSHSAASKDVFAAGAINAARFLADKPAGLYSMRDLFV